MNMKMIKQLICFLLVSAFVSSVYAQKNQKLAQTGFQFLSINSDAKAAGMAEAVTSMQTGSASMFFNPAGMASLKSYVDVSGSINKWIADIKHTSFAVAAKPFDGDYGVFGLSLQLVDYGEFLRTVVSSNALGYEDLGTFKLQSYAAGFGYAKQISDRFSVGGHIKYVHQDLGTSTIAVVSGVDTSKGDVSNTLSPLVFDFGTQFRTGIKSLVFGMSVRNFSTEVKYAKEGIQAPLIFTLGISMDVMDLVEKLPYDQSLYLALDASHYKDHPEQVKLGLDYRFMDMLSLRVGYASGNDENGVTYGLGLRKYGFELDYAYTPFGIFDSVQRFTFRFAY